MMFTSFAATDGISRQPETIGQTISIAN